MLIQYQHGSKVVKEYMKRNEEDEVEYFPVGSPEFNVVGECWKQGKYKVLSKYCSSFTYIKLVISHCYRTIRSKLDIN